MTDTPGPSANFVHPHASDDRPEIIDVGKITGVLVGATMYENVSDAYLAGKVIFGNYMGEDEPVSRGASSSPWLIFTTKEFDRMVVPMRAVNGLVLPEDAFR